MPRLRLQLGPLVLAVAIACAGESSEPAEPAIDPAAPVEGTLVGAEGARLFYQVVGVGPDTLFVLHGGPGAGIGSVRPDFEPLAERHTLVFYDQRGGGRSELPADTTLLDRRTFVEDLDAVRRHFGAERMILLAHSFGAILAAQYAIEHPQRVERMILHGATGPSRDRAAEVARRSGSSRDPATDARLREAMEVLISGSAEDPVAACREYEGLLREKAAGEGSPSGWKGTTCAADPEAVRYAYRYTARLTPMSFGDWDYTCAMGDVEAPLLVVYGDRDSLGLAQQEAWAAAAPNGRLVTVPNAGKGAAGDRPEVVFAAIDAFLAGGWPAAARTVERESSACRPSTG